MEQQEFNNEQDVQQGESEGPKYFIDGNQSDMVDPQSNDGDNTDEINQNKEKEGEENQDSKLEFTEEQQKFINSKISEKVTRAKEAERKAQELEQRIAELERSSMQNIEDIVDPDPPNILDADYDQKIVEWKNAVNENASKRAEIKLNQTAQQQNLQLSKQAAIHDYTKRASTLGIDTAKLQDAAQTLYNFGVESDSDLESFILTEPQGPKITTYLADNVVELDAVVKMSYPQQVAYLYKNVLPKISNSKVNKKPVTSDGLTPSGGIARRSPNIRGYKFE